MEFTLTLWISKLSQKLGWHVTAVLAAVVVIVGMLVIWLQIKPSNAIADSRKCIFVCSETGKAFTGTPEIGEPPILISPYSGKRTGYPAELCYWTADGKVRKEPFPVLLNEQIDKAGPTFCPDCGRLVVHHNPMAEPGRTPPPTRAEYDQRKSKNKGQP